MPHLRRCRLHDQQGTSRWEAPGRLEQAEQVGQHGVVAGLVTQEVIHARTLELDDAPRLAADRACLDDDQAVVHADQLAERDVDQAGAHQVDALGPWPLAAQPVDHLDAHAEVAQHGVAQAEHEGLVGGG